MIKTDKIFGSASMIRKETFDEYYSKKLKDLAIELKDIIKGDMPYAPSAEYACRTCNGRIFLHTLEGSYYCMRCKAMPSSWSKELKARVDVILERYPNIEECRVEWEALQPSPPVKREITGKHVAKTGSTELGSRIREARESKGWTQAIVASKIHKKNGKMLSERAIQSYERGWSYPPIYILGQLRDILGLEGMQNG
jgi:ribosome-binding protein aMBF1 (putative translation factor)